MTRRILSDFFTMPGVTMLRGLLSLMCAFGIIACSPVKTTISNQYQLTNFSSKNWAKNANHRTILVTLPEAAAGYQTSKMLYVKKPFSLKAFAKNAWVDAPASMLHPLLIESLQRSAYFKVVASTIYAEPVDYRLDSQLLKLQQNFIKKPSVIELSVKVVLTEVKKNQIIASRIINLTVPCPQDTPYGGVIAANKASEAFTATVTEFVIKGANQ